MRHVIGIALAIGLAGAVFFAASWGYLRLLRIAVANANVSALPSPGANLLHDTTVLYGVAALAGTALLAGLFAAAPRISPLAAGLPGLALVGWSVWYGLSMRHAVQYIPLRADSFGAGFEAMLENGLLAAAGLALVVPLFIPSRWRARQRPSRYWAGYPGPGQDQDQDQGSEQTATISLLTDWNNTTPYPTGEHRRSTEPVHRAAGRRRAGPRARTREPAPGIRRRLRRELRLLGRPGERHRLGVRRDRLRDQVEVPGAGLALVPGRGVAEGLELRTRPPAASRTRTCRRARTRGRARTSTRSARGSRPG